MSISLTATTSVAVDAAIRYKIPGFGTYVSGKTTLLISSKEMEYIMKIVKSLRFWVIGKIFYKTIENETNN